MAGVRRAGGRFLAARELAATASTGGGNVYFFGGGGGGARAPVARALLEDLAPGPAVDVLPPPQGPAPPSAAASRVTPAVLFVTVVLAVVLLVSGLLHVLRRLFLKTHHAGTGAGERGHLQHLFFPAHDGDGGAGGAGGSGGGGLALAAIDALPEFAYAELSGTANPGSAAAAASRKGKEKAARPFDCAVCLCEFAGHDRLRLLPPCGHAFHVACIDVWLRSSATCPLCRTKLSRAASAAAAAPSVGNDVVEEEDDESKQQQQDHQAPGAESAGSSVVLPVRLGRFQIADDADNADAAAESSTGTSGSRIDKRRCYSMGSYQYVLADEQLLVSVHLRHHGTAGAGAAAAGGSGDDHHQQQQQLVGSRKVFARGDSFSVSKIWQWRGSRRLPGALCADDGLPWAPPAAKDGDRPTTANAGQQHGDT